MSEYYTVQNLSVEESTKLALGRFRFDKDLSTAAAGLMALNPVVQDCDRLIRIMSRDTLTLYLAEYFNSELSVVKAAFAAAEAQLARLHRIRRAVVHLDILTESRISHRLDDSPPEALCAVQAEPLAPITSD